MRATRAVARTGRRIHPPILIQAVQEILDRSEQSNCDYRSTERLQIPWNEPAPEVLAECEKKHRGRNGDDVALEREDFDESTASVAPWERLEWSGGGGDREGVLAFDTMPLYDTTVSSSTHTGQTVIAMTTSSWLILMHQLPPQPDTSA